MVTRQKTKTESTRLAREYIDRIIEISRRHGMGETVSNEAYNRAVQEVARMTLRRGRSDEHVD